MLSRLSLLASPVGIPGPSAGCVRFATRVWKLTMAPAASSCPGAASDGSERQWAARPMT